jgi:predicted transcriptional regulator
MARLAYGEKECRKKSVWRLLWGHPFGLKESEIAEELGWHRRTANNYLRELAADGKVSKVGRLWFAER